MGNSVYGTKRPALITSGDVEIFYFYRPTRDTDSPDFSSFKKLDSEDLIWPSTWSDGTSERQLPGMYNLRLPVDTFGRVGFYTIYIKPKENIIELKGVGVLNNSSARGIIINENDLDFEVYDNSLIGYRVEYIDNDRRTEEFRIITSNNRCIPVVQSDGTSVRYTFSDTSNLFFCTVTPSTAVSANASAPFIGMSGERIALVNTKFNPLLIDLEITEHDIETISTMLEGSQVRNLDRGIITTFDRNGNIYHQAAYGNIRNSKEGIYHDFKEKLDSTEIVSDEKEKYDKIKENL